jgi:hypothetical protein
MPPMSELVPTEAAALADFHLYLGGISVRGTPESSDVTITKSRRELTDLFLTKHPEYSHFRQLLSMGDDVTLSRKKFSEKGRDG